MGVKLLTCSIAINLKDFYFEKYFFFLYKIFKAFGIINKSNLDLKTNTETSIKKVVITKNKGRLYKATLILFSN